jgi:hypothetical protein
MPTDEGTISMGNVGAIIKLGAASIFCFLLCGLLTYMEFKDNPGSGPTFTGLLPGLGAGLVGLVIGALVVMIVIVSFKSPPTDSKTDER